MTLLFYQTKNVCSTHWNGATYLKVIGNSGSRLVGKISCFFVTDPGVDTTTSRVKPSNVLKAKIFPQTLVQDLEGCRHEGPTSPANLGTTTPTTAHVIVIG